MWLAQSHLLCPNFLFRSAITMTLLEEVVFRKKGKLTKLTKSYVNEVYANTYARSPLPSSVLPRSRTLGKVCHVTFHSIPTKLGAVSLLLLSSFWILYYTTELKILSFGGAVLYTFAESAFTFVERKQAYTSFGQFFANLIYIPVMLHMYPICLDMLPAIGSPAAVFILLYPFNVWFLEVVEEIFLIKTIYGRNVAWIYSDYVDEMLDGCIRLGHAPAWWALGAIIYSTLPTVKAIIN